MRRYNVADGAHLWSFKTGPSDQPRLTYEIFSTPTPSADGSRLYFGANDWKLYAIDTTEPQKRGKQRLVWTYAAEDDIQASPVIDRYANAVIVGSHDAAVHAVDLDTGTQLWKFVTGDYVLGQATIRCACGNTRTRVNEVNRMKPPEHCKMVRTVIRTTVGPSMT